MHDPSWHRCARSSSLDLKKITAAAQVTLPSPEPIEGVKSKKAPAKGWSVRVWIGEPGAPKAVAWTTAGS